MMIRITGEHSINEVKQALLEKIIEAEELGVRHSRGATLYLNPTNGFGDDIEPRRHGRKVEKLYCKGPYKSAADDYVP